MNTRQKIANYCRAGYSGLYVVSYEEARVTAELVAVAKDIGYDLYTWSVTDSLMGPIGKVDENGKPVDVQVLLDNEGQPLSPIGVLDMMVPKANKPCLPEKTIILAKDYQLFTGEPNPVLIRKVKDALESGRATARRFVILGCQFKLTPELEKEFTPVEFALPDREQLGEIAKQIADDAGIALNGNTDAIRDAACGMTTTEAADAFALSVIESNKTEIAPAVVSREKCNVVRKAGLLEVVDSKTTLADIGGLENLKRDLFEKRNLFTKAARDYGLPSPRPILVVGQPGTGKSLTATATGNIFNVPLLRLEAGRLFGSLVGQSEQNWRTAFGTAKAIAPACLWIDEVDGLFSGAASSGQTDGGTTSRVIKAILQDMQMNSDGLFFVFTANDVDQLPDPLIDRCDVWAVELPNPSERECIWRIHIAKRKRDPEKFSVGLLSKLTDGYSGRQIEQLWISAMNRAFNDGGREPNNDDVAEMASRFVPTSVTMASQIEARRKRLQHRAQPASAVEPPSGEKKGRKLS